MLIVAPFSVVEVRVLKAYVEADADVVRAVADEGGAAKLAWHEATESLVARGALQHSDRGVFVTPEGAAALLDVMPIEVMRTASPTAETPAPTRGASTRPSKARRTSAGSSSRRSREAN